jgi:hypothetical protein
MQWRRVDFMEQPDNLISTEGEPSTVSHGLPETVLQETTPALKRLGPLHFTGGTFPLMGFFASAYEHISAHAAAMLNEANSDNGRST